jgi:D-amino-acid dehydrogenase
MSSTRRPVVVIGGGVIGMCTAYSLVRRGVEVHVVDRSTGTPPASWGNAGWVTPALSAPIPAPGMVRLGLREILHRSATLRVTLRPDPRLAAWLWSFAKHCTESAREAGFEATLRLAQDTRSGYADMTRQGVRFDMWSRGLTVVALDRSAAEEELEHLGPLAEHGYRLPSRVADGDELRTAEPALSDAVTAGFHISEEHHVDPRTLLVGLRTWLTEHGVRFTAATRMPRCAVDRDHVTAVDVGDETVAPTAVVLAAGAWTGVLSARLGHRIPLTGGKGYSFLVERVPGVPGVSGPLKLLEARTAITPFDGHTRVSGAVELDGLRVRIRPRALAAVRAAACRYVRGWNGTRIQEPWAGLRPMTPDGLPVIGRVPTITNAYIATGHSTLGVTLGPVTGDLLADLMLTGERPAALRPFAPERFRSS